MQQIMLRLFVNLTRNISNLSKTDREIFIFSKFSDLIQSLAKFFHFDIVLRVLLFFNR